MAETKKVHGFWPWYKEKINSVEELTELLLSLKETPGKFSTDGVLEGSPFPGLNIEGVGPVPLPLCSDQAKKIIAVATRAPFGLGEKTIVDENIRKTWSLHPDQFTLENPRFHASLESLVLKVQTELGCDSTNVKASLYKLLLYEEGGHFKPHRDSEKEDGMFATLIIQLPSVFKGNNLIVRHGEKTKIVEFDVKESEYEMIYAAHYADCEHEITPLQSGYRIALIYNLAWTSSTEPPPSVDQNECNRLTSLLPQVANEHKNVFGFSMEHKYSPISLQNGIAALKGKDRTIAVSLQTANKELNKDEQYTFYIVKLGRETIERGEHEDWEEPGNNYGEFQPSQMSSDTTQMESAFDFQGKQHDLMKIPFDVEKDLFDYEARYDSELDEFWGDCEDEEVDGPTGNNGSCRGRWYNSYIMLAFPGSQNFRILCKCTPKSALENVYEDFKTSAIHFKDHLKTFLYEIPAITYANNKETFFIKIVEILQSTCDAELINLFIVNVLQKRPSSSSSWRNERKSVLGLFYDGTEQIIGDLIKSVDWQIIKSSVEHLIEISPTVQYGRWFDVYLLTGINDICHKLIKVILSKLKSKQWSPNEKDHTVLVKLFEAVFKCEELSNRWWSEISTCVEITSNINLLGAILARLPVDDETNKYTFLIESFVDCLNHTTDLNSDVEKYASIVFDVIKPIFIDNKFQKYLICLQKSATNSVPIIGRLLGLLYHHDKSWSKMQNFQMLLSIFMDWMNVADLNKLRNEELINVAKVLYHHDEYSKDKTQNCLTPSQKIEIHNAIQTIEVAGPPKLSNQQPDAVIVGHPTVQTFLRGSEKRFKYQNFASIEEARSWVKKHFSLRTDQISKGYCCSVETWGAYAFLTKIPDHFHNEKKNAYDNLFKELISLLLNVSWKSASKRQQPMASETAAKKQAVENVYD